MHIYINRHIYGKTNIVRENLDISIVFTQGTNGINIIKLIMIVIIHLQKLFKDINSIYFIRI